MACTPMRIVLRDYPRSFDRNSDAADRILRAFVTTVIPGASVESPDLTRVYFDPFYHFASYRGFFGFDLCQRSARLYGVDRFDALDHAGRTSVIRDGLSADATTARLYSGAIFLAQISCYAGVFEESEGCPLIDFEGQYRVRPLSEISYPHPERYLPRALTRDGNHA